MLKKTHKWKTKLKKSVKASYRQMRGKRNLIRKPILKKSRRKGVHNSGKSHQNYPFMNSLSESYWTGEGSIHRSSNTLTP